jgi:hypothetical protein
MKPFTALAKIAALVGLLVPSAIHAQAITLNFTFAAGRSPPGAIVRKCQYLRDLQRLGGHLVSGSFLRTDLP